MVIDGLCIEWATGSCMKDCPSSMWREVKYISLSRDRGDGVGHSNRHLTHTAHSDTIYLEAPTGRLVDVGRAISQRMDVVSSVVPRLACPGLTPVAPSQ